MANASEILHFFKMDRDIHLFSQDSQEMLAEAVQIAFHHLVRCLQYDLQRTLPAFLDDSEDIDEMGIEHCLLLVLFIPLPLTWVLMTLRTEAFKNIDGKGENAVDQYFLLFPEYFLPNFYELERIRIDPL